MKHDRHDSPHHDAAPAGRTAAGPATGTADPPRPGDAILLAALNELLEGERAGARVARAFQAETEDGGANDALQRIGRDEAWCCAMLVRHITRLGGRASRKTGDFHERALRRTALVDRIEYLERGQAWVVKRLRTLLADVTDAALARDLERMLSMHERNVASCTALAATIRGSRGRGS